MADRQVVYRTVKTEFEIRDADSGAPTLEGYAATFNHAYDLGAFREQIDPSAFNRTLGSNPDVRFLIDHEGQPLARTKSGTLELAPDSRGLHMRAKNLDMSDPDVQRLMPKVRRGDLDEMSFAFRVPSGGDSWDDSYTLRTLRNVELNGGDVSIVTYPANPDTAGLAIRAQDVREARLVLADALFRDLRAGKTVDVDRLHRILRDLDSADTYLDQAEAGLADVLGVTNPDVEQDAHADPAGTRAASEPYGDVDYADPGYQKDGKKRYPIDTAEHVRAAWSYINQSGNDTPYTDTQLAEIKSRIQAAAKKFGIEISDESARAGRPLSLALAQARRLSL